MSTRHYNSDSASRERDVNICEMRTRESASEIEGRKDSSQYDDRAPITSFPPEILRMILKAYVSRHWMEYDAFLHDESPHVWLRALHVCTTWRAVALSTRELWTRITPTSQDYVQFAAAHCGALPVSIKIRRPLGRDMHALTAPMPVAALDAICSILPRIRRLDFVVSMATYAWTVVRALDAPHIVASELEELNVLSKLQCTAPVGPRDFIVLPTMDLPKLSTLHFSCVLGGGETLKPLLLPMLTTLVLFSHDPWVEPLSLAQMLRHLSHLEHLDITTFLRPDEMLPPYALTRTATFPCLQMLRLQDTDATCIASAQLLYHLTFPNSTCVELHVSYETERSHNLFLDVVFERLALAHDAALRYPPLACPHGLIVDISESQDMTEHRFTLCSDDCPCDLDTPRAQLQDAGLTVALTGPQNIGHTVLPGFLGRLSKHDLVSLAVHGRMDGSDWLRALVDMTRLERLLSQHDETAYALLATLSEPLPENKVSKGPSDETRPQYLFTNLRELGLDSIRWRRDSGTPQDDDLLPFALACLKRRMQQGLGLAFLKVTRAFNLTSDDARLFHDPAVARRAEVQHHNGALAD